MNGYFHYFTIQSIHMKRMFIGLLMTGAISLAACNSGQPSHEGHDTTATTADTCQAVADTAGKE